MGEFKIKNEGDYLADECFHSKNTLLISYVKAKRATRIARMRGMMKAYLDDGCYGSYSNTKAKLDSLLKNINNGKLK